MPSPITPTTPLARWVTWAWDWVDSWRRPPDPAKSVLKLRFFATCVGGGVPPFCGIGQNGGDKGDHSPNAEEGASRADHAGCTPTVQVVSQARLPEAASPTIGSSLRDRLPHASRQDVSLPCCRLGSNRREASRSSQSIHGTPLLAAMRSAWPIACPTARNGRRQGTFIFDIDQTYCSQQGKLTENTIIRGEKTKRPRRARARTSRRSTPAVVPLFRDGLADYPQRNSSAVFRELLHRGLLQGEEDRAPLTLPDCRY